MRHGYVMGSLVSTNTLYLPSEPTWLAYGGTISTSNEYKSTNDFTSNIRTDSTASGPWGNGQIVLLAGDNGVLLRMVMDNVSGYSKGTIQYSESFGKIWKDIPSNTGFVNPNTSNNPGRVQNLLWSRSAGKFFASAGQKTSGNNLMYSTRGSSWTTINISGISGTINSLNFDASADHLVITNVGSIGYYIMRASGETYISPQSRNTGGGNAHNVVYSSTLDRWLITCKNTSTNKVDKVLVGTPNGTSITFTDYPTTTPMIDGLAFWSYLLNKFVRVGVVADSNMIQHSSDGITWETITLNATASPNQAFIDWAESDNSIILFERLNKTVQLYGNLTYRVIPQVASSTGAFWGPTMASLGG